MADVGAPHAGRTVEDATTVGGEIVHILRTSEHARLALEGAVRGERHPIGVKIVWGRDSRAGVLNIHEVFLPKNFLGGHGADPSSFLHGPKRVDASTRATAKCKNSRGVLCNYRLNALPSASSRPSPSGIGETRRDITGMLAAPAHG